MIISYDYDSLCCQYHEEDNLSLLRVQSSTFQSAIQPIFAFLSVTVPHFNFNNNQTQNKQNILLIISLHWQSFVVVCAGCSMLK
jgi:hypothetical protein